MSRYFQQNLVNELGFASEQKMAQAKVLIVGAGGLGTPVATYLAAAGVGTIGIIDGDQIEMSNLHRQFQYSENQVGLSKAETLSKILRVQNPNISIATYSLWITSDNAGEIVSDFDIICDCSDNAQTRILIDEISFIQSKPLIYTAVKDWQGYVTVLNYRNKIRLSNLFSLALLEDAKDCAIAGIVNTTCGIAGSLQATEVIKIICETNQILDGEILCFSSLNSVFRKFKIRNQQDN